MQLVYFYDCCKFHNNTTHDMKFQFMEILSHWTKFNINVTQNSGRRNFIDKYGDVLY